MSSGTFRGFGFDACAVVAATGCAQAATASAVVNSTDSELFILTLIQESVSFT
jgi:hypothetical protein